MTTNRDEIKAMLRKAKLLVEYLDTPKEYDIPIAGDFLPIKLPQSSKSVAEMVDEDRNSVPTATADNLTKTEKE